MYYIDAERASAILAVSLPLKVPCLYRIKASSRTFSSGMGSVTSSLVSARPGVEEAGEQEEHPSPFHLLDSAS